jgi:glycine cleavage system H protein
LNSPTDRRYSKEHEWVLTEPQGVAFVGITDYAQDQLGDVVYVDLPNVGDVVNQFDKLGEIESVKAVSDFFSPISGEISETNGVLIEKPELVNSDPYDSGWIVKLSSVDGLQLNNLLNSQEYDLYLSEIEH